MTRIVRSRKKDGVARTAGEGRREVTAQENGEMGTKGTCGKKAVEKGESVDGEKRDYACRLGETGRCGHGTRKAYKALVRKS